MLWYFYFFLHIKGNHNAHVVMWLFPGELEGGGENLACDNLRCRRAIFAYHFFDLIFVILYYIYHSLLVILYHSLSFILYHSLFYFSKSYSNKFINFVKCEAKIRIRLKLWIFKECTRSVLKYIMVCVWICTVNWTKSTVG